MADKIGYRKDGRVEEQGERKKGKQEKGEIIVCRKCCEERRKRGLRQERNEW